jgi:hypothetical protein
MKIGEMKFNNEKKYPDSLDFNITEKLIIERNKSVDSAVMVEIQKIAVEGGIETKFILNERNILNALKKQIPQKAYDVEYPWAICPNCGGSIWLENVQEYLHNQENSHCEHCGQAIDWSK